MPRQELTDGTSLATAEVPATERARLRRTILSAQAELVRMAEAGSIEPGDYPLRHYFTPVDPTYGCCLYAREIFLPKGHVIIGKIHRQPHLAFVLTGKLTVVTEFGTQAYEAPCTIVAPAFVKRALYIHEDTIWTTVHLTAHSGEAHLDTIEEEVIAPTYEALEAGGAETDLPQRGGTS